MPGCELGHAVFVNVITAGDRPRTYLLLNRTNTGLEQH